MNIQACLALSAFVPSPYRGLIEFLFFVVFMCDKYLENKCLFNTVFLILINVKKNNEIRVKL
jgi:hypothetical protein